MDLTMTASLLEAALRRDRVIIIAALSALTILAWVDLVWLVDDMSMGGMDMTGFRMVPAGQGLMMPATAPWQPVEFAYVFAMWTVMMIGMMTPSVAPMILIYARVGRQAAMKGQPFAASGWFASGYLIAWMGFSLAATLAQWALQRAALLTPMMESASNLLGGLVLIAAGIYQWTPLKDSCLSFCQAHFSQQVETLAPDLKPGVRTNASDIAPRPCQAFDNAEADRVGHQSDDRDGGRSCLEFQHEEGPIR
jgi:predicted metal-binding membrane protein